MSAPLASATDGEPVTPARIGRAARERLGFEALRPGQAEAVAAVTSGRDTLVVLPTGSGKSAVYQLAGLLLPGPTVIVSPLIALHQDQLRAIAAHGAGGAAVANSTLGRAGRREALAGVVEGDLEFLLLAPEQFANGETVEALRRAQPSLFVVDEAHCVSAWGHDFRPDYLRLADVVRELGRPPVLALTATASPPVRDEIVERLGLEDPAVIVRGFDRPNIRLAVSGFHDGDQKRQALLARVELATGPGIVYTSTRRSTEELAADLGARRISAAAYHGGMRAADRRAVQQAFMDGELHAICATTAFGMGIDKPDVRFVYHLEVSESLDSYYQEVGRAGRDGLPADAHLFFRTEDVGLRRFFASGGRLGGDALFAVADAAAAIVGPVEPVVLGQVTRLPGPKLASAVRKLAATGALEVLPDGRVEFGRAHDPAAAARAAAGTEDAHRALEQSRVEMIRAYAEARTCRRAVLLGYFGEHLDGECGNCDNCEAGVGEGDAAEQAGGPFRPGQPVRHGSLGDGTVVRADARSVVVLFDGAGYRRLDLGMVAERDLLAPR